MISNQMLSSTSTNDRGACLSADVLFDVVWLVFVWISRPTGTGLRAGMIDRAWGGGGSSMRVSSYIYIWIRAHKIY